MAFIYPMDRVFKLTADNNGDIAELGPGAPSGVTGAMVIQFSPSPDFVGGFAVVARAMGQAAKAAGAALMPVPYRRVTVNNIASDYTMVADLVTGATIIQVPSNGLSIGLLVNCTAGSCQVFPWDLAGASSV